jgi:ParB-like chromosome segregation protein Spo0J
MRAINWAIEQGYEIPYVKAMLSIGNEEDRIFAMVITGIDKKLLNPLEEGEAYKRLINFGYKTKEIATRVGKTQAHVYNVLKLADAPKVVKDAITNNAITATTVTQLIREVKDPNDLIEVVTNAIRDAKTKINGKKAKATVKDANINKFKTPMQKMCEAHEMLTKKGETPMTDKLFDLINLFKDKNSTAKDIAKLFA